MWLFSEKDVRENPSIKHGLSPHLIARCRLHACDMISSLVSTFRLPKFAESTAKIFFHRFYAIQSFAEYDALCIATACLFLASKVEEHYVKIVDFTKHYLAIRRRIDKNNYAPKALEQEVEKILYMESLVLHVLEYDLTICHPYTFVGEYVDQVIHVATNSKVNISIDTDRLRKQMKEFAWSFLNDSSVTTACLRMSPQAMAAVVVYLAGMYNQTIPRTLMTTQNQLWYTIFGMTIHDLQEGAKIILERYSGYESSGKLPPPGIYELLQEFGLSRVKQIIDRSPGALSARTDDAIDSDTNGNSDTECSPKSVMRESASTLKDLALEKTKSFETTAVSPTSNDHK